MPQKKVTAATVGAAVATLIVALLHGAGVDLTPEAQGAVTTLCVFGFGYLKSA